MGIYLLRDEIVRIDIAFNISLRENFFTQTIKEEPYQD